MLINSSYQWNIQCLESNSELDSPQEAGGRALSLRGRSEGTDCNHWTPPVAKMCLLEGSWNAEWPVFGPHFTSFAKPLGLQRSLATEAKDQFRKVLSRAFLSSSWPSHLVWNSRRFITDCPQQRHWKSTSWYYTTNIGDDSFHLYCTSRDEFQQELVVPASHCELTLLLGKLIIMWQNGGCRREEGFRRNVRFCSKAGC